MIRNYFTKLTYSYNKIVREKPIVGDIVANLFMIGYFGFSFTLNYMCLKNIKKHEEFVYNYYMLLV